MGSTTRTTAADTTSMKQTMETISTITARMVTETTTAKASTPAPASSIENYYDGSCGYTSYDEEYRCWHQCENEYGGYYNDYDGETTGGYETTYPPTDDDSGPTSREGGRGH